MLKSGGTEKEGEAGAMLGMGMDTPPLEQRRPHLAWWGGSKVAIFSGSFLKPDGPPYSSQDF